MTSFERGGADVPLVLQKQDASARYELCEGARIVMLHLLFPNGGYLILSESRTGGLLCPLSYL